MKKKFKYDGWKYYFHAYCNQSVNSLYKNVFAEQWDLIQRAKGKNLVRIHHGHILMRGINKWGEAAEFNNLCIMIWRAKSFLAFPFEKIKPRQNRYFPSGGSLNVLLSTLLAFFNQPPSVTDSQQRGVDLRGRHQWAALPYSKEFHWMKRLSAEVIKTLLATADFTGLFSHLRRSVTEVRRTN